MKKNKFLRLASFMLIACLATCCAVGGTFAKYTTSGSATDSARVAKWGIVLEIEGNGAAFSTTEGTAPNYTVKSSDTVKVVAPGTEGKLASYKFTGTPEVALNLKAVIDFELGDKWSVGGTYYCPLVITVGTEEIKGMTFASVDLFEQAVEDEIAKLIFGEAVVDDPDGTYAKDYVAGATLNQVGTAVEINWAWDFYTSDENDVKDTALGDAAAAGNAPTINFSLVVTATQNN